jgi:hypothetical protein
VVDGETVGSTARVVTLDRINTLSLSSIGNANDRFAHDRYASEDAALTAYAQRHAAAFEGVNVAGRTSLDMDLFYIVILEPIGSPGMNQLQIQVSDEYSVVF